MELHNESLVSIPGFVRIKQKIREKKFKGPKVAGGIGVFVRSEIVHLVELVENKCVDSIWVKISKNQLDEEEDIFIGTYYISPQNSKQIPKDYDFFSEVNAEISYFGKKGTILLQGDLNCRIGQDSDYVYGDKSDELLGIENFSNQNTRNSEDKTSNARGSDLLDLCKLNDLLILNGRTTGDIFGKFTNHNWNGSSVVDYIIVPNEFYDNVSNFSVSDYVPWISDHCMIKTTIKVSNLDKIEMPKNELSSFHPGFLWNEQTRCKFEENLNLPYFQEKFEATCTLENVNPLKIATEIKSLLMENSKLSLKVKKIPSSNQGVESEPWFDHECREKKDELRSLANKLRKKPSSGDLDIRNSLFMAKRNFKRIIATKKRHCRQKAVAELENKKTDGSPKEFWNLFRKISPKSKKNTVMPNMSKFVEHFKKISNSSRPLDIPPVCSDVGPLDFTITSEELLKAAEKLKFGKAFGFDLMCNEMIIALVKTHPKIILKLFNTTLFSNEVVPDWVIGMIVPLFKDGSKLDPNNYRGITLMSCLGKLFLSILNGRLTTYALDNQLLTKSALGFVAGNRCSDAHVIIHNLVNKVCHQDRNYIYSCFVDFKKAFDSVPRDLLLKKLLATGVSGKFFNIIRYIYTMDKACVKLGNSYSEFFELSLGVRQGCILSPLLFNIFISDLAKKFETMENGFSVGEVKINSLFWADDLVLFAKSKEDLDNLLKTLEVYCKENEIAINTKKTKCMIFNKGGRLMRRAFYLDGVLLENVRSYKYLGFLITPSGEIHTGLKDLRDRAMKAYMKIKHDMGVSFNQNIPTTLSLIDALVKPILLYCADFWGCLKLPKNNPFENLHMMMCKHLLGVQKQTTNLGVLLELGRIPLHLFASKFAIKNWERIQKGFGNSILLESCKSSALEGGWMCKIKSTLETNGMLNFFDNLPDSIYPFVHKKLFDRLKDNFYQMAFSEIGKQDSKLRTYALFKREAGFENYLMEMKNVSDRVLVSKFRLSNHRLMIEVGRHSGIPKEQRFCPFCPSWVENEAHFLFCCPTYKHLRGRYLNPVFNSHGITFRHLPHDARLQILLNNPDQNTCKFIALSMDLRQFLTAKPRIPN